MLVIVAACRGLDVVTRWVPSSILQHVFIYHTMHCAPAVVVLAVLAFFALRPGKGWLRRKTVPAPPSSLPSSKPVTPILSLASDYNEGISKETGLPPLVPGSDPAALSVSFAEAPNSPPRASRSMASALHATNSLPDSYVSTGMSSSALLTFREPGTRTDRCIVGLSG